MLRKRLERIPGIRKVYSPVQRTHPIDAIYEINTSGSYWPNEITSNKTLLPLIHSYIGSQPSIIRRALQTLGDLEEYTFVDLGCGKGRVAVVASEFSFRKVIGIELSPTLAAIARRNVAVVARRFPNRPSITIATANVTEYPLPPGKLVLFNYNAFGPEINGRLIEKMEAALSGDTPHLFFVNYNAVYAAQIDASPAFKRYFAQQIPYDASELGFGPDTQDAVVIWQSLRGAILAPREGADRKIRVLGKNRAVVESQ